MLGETEVWERIGWWSFLQALADGYRVISCIALYNISVPELFYDHYFFLKWLQKSEWGKEGPERVGR